MGWCRGGRCGSRRGGAVAPAPAGYGAVPRVHGDADALRDGLLPARRVEHPVPKRLAAVRHGRAVPSRTGCYRPGGSNSRAETAGGRPARSCCARRLRCGVRADGWCLTCRYGWLSHRRCALRAEAEWRPRPRSCLTCRYGWLSHRRCALRAGTGTPCRRVVQFGPVRAGPRRVVLRPVRAGPHRGGAGGRRGGGCRTGVRSRGGEQVVADQAGRADHSGGGAQFAQDDGQVARRQGQRPR